MHQKESRFHAMLLRRLAHHSVLMLSCAVCASTAATALAADDASVIRMGSQPSQLMATKITVTNLRQSYEFYTKVIGLKEVELPASPKPVFDDPNVKFTQVGLNFTGSIAEPFVCIMKQNGIVPNKDQAMQTWLIIKTADIDAVVNRAKAKGLSVDQRRSIRGALLNIIYDPDGYTVELLQVQSVEEGDNRRRQSEVE